MSATISVRSARTDNRVAIFEQNSDHPGGEIFIAGDDPTVHVVAPTAQVMRAIAEAVLVIVPTEEETPSEPERAARPRSNRMAPVGDNR